jgi:OOP family OmpA-OmpF porin
MRPLFPVLLGVGLIVSACQDRAEPTPEPTETPAPRVEADTPPEGTSIMRPEVLAETEAPTPLPDPVEAQVLFGLGETSLTDEARAMLDALIEGKALADGRWTVTLTGRTDASGNPAINQRVARERAEAVQVYLVSKGIAPDRIAIIAAGEPEADPQTAASPMQSRRVDIQAEARRAED